MEGLKMRKRSIMAILVAAAPVSYTHLIEQL